jgi:hypothetical protein
VAAGVNYAAGVNPPQPGGGRQWPVSVVWEGSTWKLAPVPHPQKDTEGAYLFGVDCSAATACTAVGHPRGGGLTPPPPLRAARPWLNGGTARPGSFRTVRPHPETPRT